MNNMEIPISKLGNDKFQLMVDMRLYTKEAIAAAIYKFSHLFYMYQQIVEDTTLISIIFESKEGNVVTDEIPKQFCNELIDQQLRHNVNAQFGHIRDMIVKEAFKPINSK